MGIIVLLDPLCKSLSRLSSPIVRTTAHSFCTCPDDTQEMIEKLKKAIVESTEAVVPKGWDIENVGIPAGTHPFFSVEAIKSVSSGNSFIFAVGNPKHQQAGAPEILKRLGVLYVPSVTGKNIADKKIIAVLESYRKKYPRGDFAVVSSDNAFSELIDAAVSVGVRPTVLFNRTCCGLLTRALSRLSPPHPPIYFPTLVESMMNDPATQQKFIEWKKNQKDEGGTS